MIIIATVVSVIIVIFLTVLVLPSIQQQTPHESDDELLQRDEIIWQKLQKTYLEQECREKYVGQLDKMEECFDHVKEEQRLNPPTELRP
jgi:type II secretory pathway pseudopilin PulG